jgi:nitrite reductase (NO-forming)
MDPPASPPASSEAAAAGNCRRRRRPRSDGALRPTDVVGAFFVGGIAFLLAATVVGVVQWLDPWPWGRWLALHLAFVGGVSQLVLGASQFFAGAFLATEPPPRALVRAQAVAWNGGAILLAVAVPEGAGAPIWIAVGLLLAGLVAWAVAIAAMLRRSLRRSPWATRWYVSSAVFFGLGMLAGSLLAHGTPWSHGDLLATHMSLNLAGWFGGAIVGTLHTFYPSLTQTQLRRPRLQGVAFVAWTGGVGALAIGYGWSLDAVAVGGWLALCLAALALLVNVAASLRSAPRPLSLAARLVGVAQPFLLAGLLIAAVAAIQDGAAHALIGSTRAAVGTLLVAGWIGLTVAGSLLHLLALLLRVRDFSRQMPAARPRLDGLFAALAAFGVAAVALSQSVGPGGWGGSARAVLLIAYAVLGARVATLAARVIARARPSI